MGGIVDAIFGGGDTPSAPQPDPAIGQAATVSAEVAREQLAYQKQRDAELQPIFDRIVDSNLGSMDDNRARATEQWNRYKEKGTPMEDKYLLDAQNYGTDADQQVQAGRAMQDVTHQFETQDAASKRDMMRYGVNPNSGRFAGTQRTLDLGQAAGTAAAGTNARNNTRLLGMSMRENASKFVRGMPTTGIAADSLALSSGAGAGNSLGQQANISNAGTNLALQANRDTANILTGQFNAQNSAYQNSLQQNRDAWGGFGTLAGMGMKAFGSGNTAAAMPSGTDMGAWGYAKGGEVKKPRALCYAKGGRVDDGDTLSGEQMVDTQVNDVVPPEAYISRSSGSGGRSQKKSGGGDDEGSQLGSIAGSLIGSYFGGPVGSMIGSSIGKKLFNAGGRVRCNYTLGGEAIGAGTGTSDSIPAVIDGEAPAAISNGEYVVKADTTQNVYGPDTMDDVNEGKAEIIPSKVLTEIGRKQIRSLAMAMAGGGKRGPMTIEQGGC